AAVTHTAIWTANRNRGDLAVLRALGLTRRHATRIVIAASAMVVVTSGLIGGAVGVVLGRASWTAVAGTIAVATDLRVPPFVFLTPLVIVGVVWVLGRWAGRRAVRAPAGAVLRAE
ncbi:MAG: FtsX-like permease family protein, partial [Ilumatobacter sp.]